MKANTVIIRETRNIMFAVLILSAVLQSVFLIAGWWDYTVLLGNIVGGFTGILNFYLMGLGLQKALDKDSKTAKTAVMFSHTYRNIMVGLVMVMGILLPFLNTVSTIISIFFASFGVYIRAYLFKNLRKQLNADTSDKTFFSDEKNDNESLSLIEEGQGDTMNLNETEIKAVEVKK